MILLKIVRTQLGRISLKARLLMILFLPFSVALGVSLLGRYSLSTSSQSIRALQTMVQTGDRLTEAAFLMAELLESINEAYRNFHPGKPVSEEKLRVISEKVDRLDQKFIEYSLELDISESLQEIYINMIADWEPLKSILGRATGILADPKGDRDELTNLVAALSQNAKNLNLNVATALKAIDGTASAASDKGDRLLAWSDRASASATVLAILILGAGWVFASQVVARITSLSAALKTASISLNDAVTHVTRSASALTEGVEKQEQSFERSATNISQMNLMIQQSQKGAENAMSFAIDMAEKADRGLSGMSQLEAAMQAIQDSNQKLSNIGEIIKKIEKKADVINQIVFKTQILAFNAAIEAARAGEQGRGFSVVAKEVSQLAEVSGKSSNEIRQLLKESQMRAEETVQDVNRTILQAEESSRLCVNSFGVIHSSVAQVNPLVESILNATTRQADGARHHQETFSRMSEVTRQNFVIAREIQSLAPGLQDQSKELEGQVLQLDAFIIGRRAS